MSNQPLPLSKKINNQNLWQESIILADLLTTHFSVKPLLTYIAHIFESYLTSAARVWLDPSFLPLLVNGGLQDEVILSSDLLPLMEQSYQERRIIPVIRPGDAEASSVIALPLMAKESILGVLQVEKLDQAYFSPEDVEFVIGITSQFSLALLNLQQKSHIQFLHQNITLLKSIEDISKSILSNLDRDSLLNSVLSLIHQKFDFTKVNIYIARGEENKTLMQFEISEEGIEAEKIYYTGKNAGLISWSLSHTEPVIINNTSLDIHFSTSAFENNIRSKMVIPLLYGELIVGVLELCSDSADGFGPDLLIGIQILTQNIAVAIRNANLYQSEQMKRLITDRLQVIMGTISAEVTVEDILQNLLDELEKLLLWEAAAIWLIENSLNESGMDQVTPSLRLAAARSNERISTETGKEVSIDTNKLLDKYIQNPADAKDLLLAYPWVSEIINSETAVIRNSSSPYEPFGALLGFEVDYSALAAPLVNNNQPMGVIVLVHHLNNQYDVASQFIANTFTKNASIVIENIKLYSAAHDQAWISTVLLQVAEATQSITNIDELLETMIGMLPGLIGVGACTIFLWDQPLEAFYPGASYGFETDQLARFTSWDIYPGSVPAFDQLKLSNNPVILSKENLTDAIVSQVFPNYDFRSDLLIVFPLTSQSSLCGAILIDFSNSSLEKNSSQEVWDENYTLIQGVAHQTAIAIENLQLIKAQEEESYISVALLQVAQAIVSLNKLDEILGLIVRITPILVGVKRCIIYLWDSNDLIFRQSEFYGFSKNELMSMREMFKANEFPFLESILLTNQIIYHPVGPANSPLTWNEFAPGDYHVIEEIIPDSEEEISIKLDSKSLTNRERLLIGFPLSVKGEILGIMLIEEEVPIKGTSSLHIREKRMEIVKGITQQGAIAIKNDLLQHEAVKSERMERDLQLAREIQATFLPDQLPVVSGWDIGVRWQPARQVGGDFYDILTLDDDRIGFVIADVADKGMPAALFMTLIRTLIRAAAKDKSSPAAVLKQVNNLLVPDSKHGMFVTIFYGVISLSTGSVIYANAGHNPPIVKQIDREELIELTRTSMALGIFDDIEVEEREMQLHPGDWMLLYTDGVTEAFSANEEIFGTDRLYKLLLEYQFVSANGLLDRIEGSVNKFIEGTDLSDDMTLTAIYRKLL